MENFKKALIICLLLITGIVVQAQTSGTIYVRDDTPTLTFYTTDIHVYDSFNGYSEVGIGTSAGNVFPNITCKWSGGRTLTQDNQPRWLIRIVVTDNDFPYHVKDSYYPSLITTLEYFNGGLNMPDVTMP